MRSWDKLGGEKLQLHRIENFELKVPAKRGKKGEPGMPARVDLITRDAVVVKDIGEMVKFVRDQRSMEEEKTVVRVSIDSGGGSLKVLGSIFHEIEEPKQPGMLLTGVNKIILLAYVEDLQESWVNLRILLELQQLYKVRYILSADLKLINILLGISSHSGKYACFSCYREATLVAGPPRTYQNLAEAYQAYADANFPKGRMSHFYNVIKPCLINPSNLSSLVGDIIPIPELHSHIGVGNWGWDWVKRVMGEARYKELEKWAAKRSISIRGYHGSGLNGNNCKNFFKASKDLYLLIGDKTAAPVTDMLEKFDKVTKACFSRELSSDWRIVLEEFKTSVWELISFSKFELNMEINVTWKLHLIVAHLRPFLEKTGKGLADYSKQMGESNHYKGDKEMSRFKWELENPNYGEKVLSGARRFNSKRF